MMISLIARTAQYFLSRLLRVIKKSATLACLPVELVQVIVVSIQLYICIDSTYICNVFPKCFLLFFSISIIKAGCHPGTWKNVTGDCITCPLGYFTAKQNVRLCSTCPLGWFASSKEKTRDRCYGCPRGKFGVQISAISQLEGCSNCSSGRYSEIEAVESPNGCKGCPMGKWSSLKGADSEVSCLNCGAGKYGRLGSGGADSESSCISCGSGKYLEIVGGIGSSLCKSCPIGYSQQHPGNAFCLPCTPGSYQMVSGASGCLPCSVGKASTLVARTSDCDICNAGRHQPTVGMTTCLTCIP